MDQGIIEGAMNLTNDGSGSYRSIKTIDTHCSVFIAMPMLKLHYHSTTCKYQWAHETL